VLARFVSADSVVPGNASGGMDGVALKGLTVDFHEPGYVAQIGGENNQPFWFQMSDRQRQQAGDPWGPRNPQALNRYSYVLNGPMRYTDPMGHSVYMTQPEAAAYVAELRQLAQQFREQGNDLIAGGGIIGGASSLAAASALALLRNAGIIGRAAGIIGVALGFSLLVWANQIDTYASLVAQANQDGDDGVVISSDPTATGRNVTVISRATGNGYTMTMAIGPASQVFNEGPNLYYLSGERWIGTTVWASGFACTRNGGDPSPGKYYSGDRALCSAAAR